MLVQDVVTLSVLGFLAGGALLFSLVFTTGWWSNRVEAFIRKSGEDINWSHLNSLGMHSEQWKAYGVPEFKEKVNVFEKHRHIRQALVKTMREHNVAVSIEEFSLFVLHVRGGSVRFNDYIYETWRPRSSRTSVLFSLDECAKLSAAGFDSDSVFKLAKHGLSFEQVLASKGMPAEWALRVFSEATV